MVAPQAHNKAKLIYRVGVEPPHRCDARCYETAAEIAAAEECEKCESSYELIYYDERHVVSRVHRPGCPNTTAPPMAKDVHAVVNGKLIGEDMPLEELFKCPLGCEMQIDAQPTGTNISHRLDCPLWRPDKPQE